jgi:two-component system nitrate/nitrite response regulator NarL
MSSVSGPPRVSRFGWNLAATKGRAGKSDHTDSPTVLIATADPEIRGRWRGVLQGPYPVRDVSTRDCLERSIATLSPDVLLLDLDLLGVGGIGDGPIIRALARDTKVVLLSAVPNEREGVRILKAGARGYCDRNVDPQLLRKVVDRIHDGEIWAERKLIPHLLEEYASRPEAHPEIELKSDSRLRLLTPREREIAFLIGGGASNKEIARRLRVGEGTVKAHLTAIFRKLGFSDRLQLGLFLVRPGAAAERKSTGAEASNGPPVDHLSS